MEHLSLYRRYRPGRFADVRGQRHVVKALQNAVREDRVGHAYLLSGPRGTGKTTLARILAKVLNCEAPADGEPCGTCPSCKAIESGTSFDLHELDAASNNKVDDMRDLLAKVALGTPGRTKVYLLDEVHMLSSGAENALLKTLEEPPDHVVFVLATTEPHKVVPTVRSRTQHLELTLLGADELAEHVRWVVADAALDAGDDIVDHVVRAGGGSVRDTLSALDQVVAAGGMSVDDTSTAELLEALATHDPGRALTAMAEATRLGRDPRVIGESLLDALRNVFLVAMGASATQMTALEREQAETFAPQLSPPAITRALELVGTALVDMRQAPDPRVDLEVALVRLTRAATDGSLEALAERLSRLERMVADGAVPSSAAGPAPASESSPGPSPAGPRAGTAASEAIAAPAEPAASSSSTAPRSGSAAAPTPPARSGPANEARSQLARATGRERSGPARPPRPGRAGPASAPAPDREHPTAPDDAAPAPVADPVAGSGGLPSLADITAQWDSVLQSLPQKVKVRYSTLRVAEVTDTHAVLALPSEGYRKRCEEVRPAVEGALAERFGVPVPLKLVTDEGGTPPSSEDPPPVGSPPPDEPEPMPVGHPDEHIDLEDLTDAPAGGGVLEKLTSAFPGAELLDEQ